MSVESSEGPFYVQWNGREVGPFAHLHTAIGWLELRGVSVEEATQMVWTKAEDDS